MTYHHITLDNGLTVIGEHNAEAQSFAAGYFVKTGSRDEAEPVAGVSHFLEHMMFKGTDRRSAADINREFDELGANYNAYTNDEATVYYGAVLPERSAKLLDLLTDMMRPALRQEDFDMEKNVILEEIAMYEDRPNFKVFEDGNRLYFGSHPLGNSVLGSADSIRALRREQMLEYFQRRYAPNNLTLTVAGNYQWRGVIDQVRRLTKDWRPAETGRNLPDLDGATGEKVLTKASLKRVHVATYAPGVSAQDPKRYVADVLAECLGGSSGSRLYWALVDPGLAESASLSHDSSDGAGTFIGYLSTDVESLEKVLAVYREVLQRAQDEPISEEEWLRAQRKLATGSTLRGETPFGRLMSLGSAQLYNREYRTVQETVERIMSKTIADARDLLAERSFDKLFTVVLTPGTSG